MTTTRFFMFVAIFLLSVSLCYAVSFDAKVTPINDKIVVDEIAEFELTIQNNLDSDEEFTIKKAGYPYWDMYTKPLQSPITLNVPGLSSASIKIFVDPLYITSVDTYTLDVGVVMERTGIEQKVPITIGIKSIEPLIGGYIPTVLATVNVIPEEIDPRENFVIKIILNNQNILDYPNLTVKIDSDLIKDELQYPLGPKEERSIEITKKLDDMSPPQEGKIVLSIYRGDRLIVNPILKELRIKEYSVQEVIPKEQSFLKIRKGVKVVSNNPYHKEIIKIETTPFKNLFLTTSPRAQTLKEDNKQYLVWEVELGEDKEASVYTTENYRPLVIIFVLVVVAIIIYFMFRSPIIVKKNIANVGTSEGGISEAKVVVRVKNRSRKPIINIEVIDNLPHIVHVEKEISIGSMQPHTFLQHPKKGLVIKWIIETLEPGDERVLSYKMKSRLPILGELTLPAANARCKVNNKVVISNSNRVSVGV